MPVDSGLLHDKLKAFFGYDTFKGDQEAIITNLLEGEDAFVLMPTGGGKSLCYQLPALMMQGTAIVISPLIALMKNQVDAIRGFACDNECVAHFLNSSLNKAQLEEVRSDVKSGKTKLLYVAPESLTKEENVELLKEVHVSFYAVDEAHCISEWGHDFRPEYRRIRAIVEDIGREPIIALTATATPKVQSDILKNLGIHGAKVFKSSFNRSNLYYEIRDKVDADKDMIRLIKQNPGKPMIIYCLSRKKVEEMASLLCINGIPALPYHAGLDARTRTENQNLFLMDEVNIMVATIAFGMGIDKPDVRFVIHYDIPKSIESYYQETGRAGRDGREGRCITYYSYKDIQKLEKFLQGKPVAEQEIGKALISEVVAYAESNQCRRKLLLNYFGEDYPSDNCGMCDNCIHPKKIHDGKQEVGMVLELVRSLPEHFKTEHLANILAGQANALIKSYHHDTLPLFGKGKEHNEKYWATVIHQALIAHLIDKEIDAYGLIFVTPRGEAFLENPYFIPIVEGRVFSDGDAPEDDDDDLSASPSSTVGGGGGDPVLLAMLKDLRKDLARKLNLQPWILFSDPALEDMSIFYPIKMSELTKCQGVGEGKARKYGQEFVKLIAGYVEENEISRPDDLVVKSAPSKSQSKVFIIQSIDKRMDLDDIAGALNLDLPELMDEIEAIVSTGTKLDISYYVSKVVDPEIKDEIYDYFREEAASDSLEDAIAGLGDDYEEMEVRLVRIKFLCEIAS